MKIFYDPGLGGVHDLVSFSDTVVPVRDACPQAVGYRTSARLPVDFRLLNGSEVEEFTAPMDQLTIDDELDFVAVFRCDLGSESELDFAPFLSLSPVVELDPSADYGDSPSITVDRGTGLRLGLHLDNWDGLELAQRWKSRNRVVVNRGPGERHLYVVPVSIEEMAESVHSADRLHPCEVADTYLRGLRDLRNSHRIPCLRLRQPPNVGYVCCTERVVHDACVGPGGMRAESRHYLGHFVRA